MIGLAAGGGDELAIFECETRTAFSDRALAVGAAPAEVAAALQVVRKQGALSEEPHRQLGHIDSNASGCY